MIVPGRYAEELDAALRSAGAVSGILVIFDGKHGTGLSVHGTMDVVLSVPSVLRDVADRVEKDNSTMLGGQQ